MFEKFGIRSTHTQSGTTTNKTDNVEKDNALKKAAATAMPSSRLPLNSFAHKAKQKLTGHSAGAGAQHASGQAFSKLGFDAAHEAASTHLASTSKDSHDAKNSGHSNPASGSMVADVPAAQRDAQYAAAAAHNRRFEAHLHGLGLEVVRNSGSNNNCAIYSLLDIAAPRLSAPQRHQAADEIRASFDKTHPQEKGQMLLLDMQAGGHGRDLVSIVNKKFGVDMSVGVVQAGYEESHPMTQLGTLRAQGSNSKPPTHQGVVWDQHGHYEAIREAAPEANIKKPALKTDTPAKPVAAPSSSATAPSSSPLTKLAAIGKWRTPAPGAKSADKAKGKTESYQLSELNFKTETADWAKDTEKAVTDASKLKETPDPKFVLPPRKLNIGQPYDRNKPGFTAIESLGIRPFGNLFNAAAAGMHGNTSAALLGTGVGVGAVHDALLGGINGHALLASIQKGKRYGTQLESMLVKDIEKFKKDPQLATLILTKDNKGKFVYDMEKVAKLAASEEPEHKEASAHAKNVFLTAFIKDEVAGKRQNRATYEVTRNVVGFASAGAILGGTLGVAAAPASAVAIGAKSAGLGMGFANALDGAKGVRGLKQRMRDDKEREIDQRFLSKRMDMKNVAYPKSVPQEAINGAQAAMKDNAKQEANQVLFRRLLTGEHIDEKKSTNAKQSRAELAAKHAYAIVDYHVDEFAGQKEGNLEAFHRNLYAPGLSQRDRTKRRESSIKNDDSLRRAYDLMRDVGMRRGEAALSIHKLIMRKIEKDMAADPDRIGAATEAAKVYDGKPEAGDIREMRTVLRRH